MPPGSSTFSAGIRRAIEAAQYDIDAAVAARNVVLVSLVADVIRAYLDLRALQMQLAVLRKNIEVAQKYSISSRSDTIAASPTSSTSPWRGANWRNCRRKWRHSARGSKPRDTSLRF